MHKVAQSSRWIKQSGRLATFTLCTNNIQFLAGNVQKGHAFLEILFLPYLIEPFVYD